MERPDVKPTRLDCSRATHNGRAFRGQGPRGEDGRGRSSFSQVAHHLLSAAVSDERAATPNVAGRLSPGHPLVPLLLFQRRRAARAPQSVPPRAAAGDPTLDGRPAWLQALDFGERVVLLTIHLFVAKLHFDIGAWMSSEMGAQMFADARKLAFTDAPKGSCGQDSIVWPPDSTWTARCSTCASTR